MRKATFSDRLDAFRRIMGFVEHLDRPISRADDEILAKRWSEIRRRYAARSCPSASARSPLLSVEVGRLPFDNRFLGMCICSTTGLSSEKRDIIAIKRNGVDRFHDEY